MALDRAASDSLGLGDIVGDGESISASSDPLTFAEGATFTPTDDGGEVIEEAAEEAAEPPDHESNLAEYIDESTLNTLASDIIQYVKEDRESRADWEAMLSEGLTYLGLKLEDRQVPFPGCSGVFDPILLEAVIRWHATASAELIPAGGPVKTQIIGQPTPETEAQSSRVKEFMNFYLTEGAPEYVEENDQMLMWLPLVGSTFKKTYQDPIMSRPVSPFITPDKFIVSANTSDLETCSRATHVIEMGQRDMKMRQLSKFYLDIPPGQPDQPSSDSTTGHTNQTTVHNTTGI